MYICVRERERERERRERDRESVCVSLSLSLLMCVCGVTVDREQRGFIVSHRPDNIEQSFDCGKRRRDHYFILCSQLQSGGTYVEVNHRDWFWRTDLGSNTV